MNRLSPPPVNQPIETRLASVEWQRWFSALSQYVNHLPIGSGTANNVAMFVTASEIGNAPGLTYDPSEGGFYNFTGGVNVAGVLSANQASISLDLTAGSMVSIGSMTAGSYNSLSLSGTGTRLVTSTSGGTLGNATTIAGNYTFTNNLLASGGNFATSSLSVNGTATDRGNVIAGASAGNQIQIDGDEIQQMNNATPSTLNLNARGGAVFISAAGVQTRIFGTLTVDQTATFTLKPILTSLTASLPVFSDASKGLVSNTMTGTGDVVMSVGPTFGTAASGSVVTLSGKTGLTNNYVLDTSVTSGTLEMRVSSGVDRWISILNSGAGKLGLLVQGRINVGGATDVATWSINVAGGGNISTSSAGNFVSFGVGVPGDTNYERMFFGHGGAGGAVLTVDKGGTGTYRSLSINVGGSARVIVDASSGNVTLSDFAVFSSTAKSHILLNSTGVNYGTIQNDSANTWSFGYKTTNSNSLGTAVLTWTPSGVSVAGTIAVTGETTLSAALTNNITTVTVDTTLTSAHHTVYVYTGSANRVITLPLASTCPGRVYVIRKSDGSANTATVTVQGSDSIEDVLSVVLCGTTANGRLVVRSAGGNYWAIEELYDEGFFTGTLTGVTSTVTGTIRWTRVGKQATILMPRLLGTSNSNSATITGMPTGIRPSRIVAFVAQVVDNSGITGGTVDGFQIQTSGTITLFFNGLSTGFTTSGTKGLSSDVPNFLGGAGTAVIPYTYTLQ